MEQIYEPPTETTGGASAGDALWVINDGDSEKRIFLSGAISFDSKTVAVIPHLSLTGNPSVSAISNSMFLLGGDVVMDPRTPELILDRLPIFPGVRVSP